MESPAHEENITNEPVAYLSESTLKVSSGAALAQQQPRPTVPRSTPHSEFLFEVKFQTIPRMERGLSELEVPCVRDKGVGRSIEEMSEFFGCTDYKFNFLQFWFLDVLTDCVWRAQDQYEFPVEQQKIILTWVIFFIDLIGDPNKNYSHEEFFEVFKETVLTAAVALEEGSGDILLPVKLVKILSENESENNESSESHQSSSTSSTRQTKSSSEGNRSQISYESVVEFEVEGTTHRVVLDHEKCICSEFGESLPSTVGRLLEDQPLCDSSNVHDSYEENFEEENGTSDNWVYTDFYKPDTEIPSRFLPLSASEELEMLKNKDVLLQNIGSSSKLTFLPIGRSDERTNQSSDKLTDYIIFRKERWQKSDEPECLDAEDGSGTFGENQDKKTASSDPLSEKTQHENIMKGLKNFKLLEQRVKDFSDSNVGLEEWQMRVPSSRDKSKTMQVDEELKYKCFSDSELEDALNRENMRSLDEQEFLSFGVLWAIIDFVYEYFSDSFQYTLIKMALNIQPNLITQQLNSEWHIPKGLKEDLTLRVKDLKDKFKTIQRKEEKKPKEVKKDKKGDNKVDKKSDKADKKKSDKADKSKKEPAKTKATGKDKKPEPTEEELRVQRQLEALEAEKLQQEMNKKFLFPLQEAIQDEFFKSKFPGWEREELTNDKEAKPKKETKKK